jgi:fatty-acyl-CoA synthase
MRTVDLLERSARLWPDKTAVAVVGGPALTYRELQRRAFGLAGSMERMGVGRGDRVALMAADGTAHAEVQLACAHLGAATVPIGMRLSAAEVGGILADAEPSVGFADAAAADRLGGGMASGAPVIALEEPAYESLAAGEPPPGILDRAREEDVALVVYTSGSTGTPKGVCLSQRALCFNGVTIALAQRLGHDEVFLSTTPLSHAATGTRITTMLLDGQTLLILPKFDAAACVDAIESWSVTSTVMVPTQLRRVLALHRDWQRSLRTLRLLVYGAAPTALPVIRQAAAELPCGLYQGYGLSEACTNLTALLPEDHAPDSPEVRLRSCGRIVPGVVARIGDEDCRELPCGEPGELLIRTEKVMTGYWRQPETTAAAFRGGWLHTGDVGTMDAEGYITIVDRAKDMLISGGVNVYPAEIEAVLYSHPSVAEVAVIGAPDEEWGEVPVAFVISAPDRQVDADSLRAHCGERLASFKVPRRIMFVDELPRTESGKIRKPALRQTLTGAAPPLSR